MARRAACALRAALRVLLATPVLACLLVTASAWGRAGADTGGTTGSPAGATLTARTDVPAAAPLAAAAAGDPTPVPLAPHAAPGIPSDQELEAKGARIGRILIDNQNIFNLDDPKENTKIFRLANHLHGRTRARIIRQQLLFKPGDRYSRRLIEESARILRANSYFYDAWIRVVGYHDHKVDLRVTTRDVWTFNPGFNFGRSGGTNSTGVKLEEDNLLGSGTAVKVSHSSDVDRSGSQLEVSSQHAFGTWAAVDANYANLSDGRLREFQVNRPFYALDSRWAAGIVALNVTQTDSLYDLGHIVDQFQDQHQFLEGYAGGSRGLRNGWVRRWSVGATYEEHLFEPLATLPTPSEVPEDRKFVYPWVQFDILQDDFLKLYDHDQIGRTEDFYVGSSASLRVGYAAAGSGSNRSAMLFQGTAGRGFVDGGTSTLLIAGDFSGRIESGELRNGVLDASARYYVEQSDNWLFFTTLVGTKGWHLDLDNQILLGGDNGLRGYPLRYQGGTARALWSVEQRYFTDWYPFRLLRVGAAVFFDVGRTWGTAPLATPSFGLLKDAGLGLRFGNARSGLGNVIHVDLAFPFNGDRSISKVQFLVQTEQHF